METVNYTQFVQPETSGLSTVQSLSVSSVLEDAIKSDLHEMDGQKVSYVLSATFSPKLVILY